MGEAVVPGGGGFAEGGEHGLVGGVVEVELYAEVRGGGDACQRLGAGKGDHHAVVLHVADGGGDVEVAQCPVLCRAEEADGAAVFEGVFRVVVFRPQHFRGQLVEGVVAVVADAHGIPADALPDAPVDVRRAGALFVEFLLVFVFLAQQGFLLPEVCLGVARCREFCLSGVHGEAV